MKYIILFLLLISQAYGFAELVRDRDFSQNYPQVFGFTHKDTLYFDGDQNGAVCARNHWQNDLSNRWCHGVFTKLVDTKLRTKIHPMLSSVMAASIFIPKEFLVDKKPSKADLGIIDYQLGRNVSVSYFGDNLVIFHWKYSF